MSNPKKKQHLTITIRDHRPEEARGGRDEERTKSYTDHKSFLADMRKLGAMKNVHVRETTHSVVELYPIEEELFPEGNA